MGNFGPANDQYQKSDAVFDYHCRNVPIAKNIWAMQLNVSLQTETPIDYMRLCIARP